ncbi:MAG: hypothetical protein ACKOW2_07100 [Sphingobacteriaceae bacterium]
MKKNNHLQASRLIEHYDKLLLRLLRDDLRSLKPELNELRGISDQALESSLIYKRN